MTENEMIAALNVQIKEKIDQQIENSKAMNLASDDKKLHKFLDKIDDHLMHTIAFLRDAVDYLERIKIQRQLFESGFPINIWDREEDLTSFFKG